MKIRFFSFAEFFTLSQGRKKEQKLIEQSDLFDAAWYLSQNADVARAGLNPVSHYLAHGASEGRDQGPFFSTDGYKRAYAHVDFSTKNPLIHYLTRSKRPNESDQLAFQVRGAHALHSPPYTYGKEKGGVNNIICCN